MWCIFKIYVFEYLHFRCWNTYLRALLCAGFKWTYYLLHFCTHAFLLSVIFMSCNFSQSVHVSGSPVVVRASNSPSKSSLVFRSMSSNCVIVLTECRWTFVGVIPVCCAVNGTQTAAQSSWHCHRRLTARDGKEPSHCLSSVLFWFYKISRFVRLWFFTTTEKWKFGSGSVLWAESSVLFGSVLFGFLSIFTCSLHVYNSHIIRSVSQKIHPRFADVFPKWLGIFTLV